MFKSFDIKTLKTNDIQSYLQSSVGPRPIAFASTINKNGIPNLSPFSFFNVFSANPPILIFSPARRVRDNTIKHTLENCIDNKEVVINIVDYNIVQQMSLSSTEYPEGVNEFIKAGFTMLKSDIVKPFRVKESPVQFECKVNEIIPLGNEAGAGNLVICEVLKIHILSSILTEKDRIDQTKLDLVSRMGGAWYSRANKGLFEIPKPLFTLGIGVDAIPDFIKESSFFDGNDLGCLGNVEKLPNEEEINDFLNLNIEIKGILSSADEQKIQAKAKEYILNNDPEGAWKILLAKRV